MAVQGGDGQRKEEEKGSRPGPHPQLCGWRRDGRKYTHGLHPAQMEALRAMCGAFIPSLPAEEAAGAGGRADPPGGKDLERFYLASAADAAIPDEVIQSLFYPPAPRAAHHVLVPGPISLGLTMYSVVLLSGVHTINHH
jgi:long-chain-alcohol oxidase